jgi:hypothetical protein
VFKVTHVRDLGEILEEANADQEELQNELSEMESSRGEQRAPWGETFSPGDDDAVQRAYWLTRDLHLADSREYRDFLATSRRTREPYSSYDDIIFFAQSLVGAADEELGVHDRPRLLGDSERAAARQWIHKELEAVLRGAYRQVERDPGENRQRSARGRLYRGVDVEAAVMDTRPAQFREDDWQQVAAVVRIAFLRSVVLTFGRRAVEEQGLGR